MDFVRFSGEFFIYFVLIALGGGVLTGITAFLFQAIGIDLEYMIGTWIVPCGALGAVIVASWLVEAKQGVRRSADVYLELSGNAKATVKTTYSGIRYEYDHLDFALNDQYDNQKKWILRNTEIPIFDLVKFSFINKKEKIPSAEVNLDLTLNRFASVSGKRLFLTPNLMNRLAYLPEKLDERRTDIVFKWGHVNSDVINYHIPENIYPEFLPEPVKIASIFGEYEASFEVDQGIIIYTRKLKVNNGRYPASSYKEFSDFYKRINKADNVKVVFLSKT
jgi:hypothetical protein